MKLKLPETCGECQSKIQMSPDGFYCTMPCGSPEQDISTVRVNLDSRPGWCPVAKMNETVSKLSYKEQLAVKAMSILFGGLDVFEDETPSDLYKIMNGLRCCIDADKGCKFDGSLCPYVDDCRSGDTTKLKRDALAYLESTIK